MEGLIDALNQTSVYVISNMADITSFLIGGLTGIAFVIAVSGRNY